jgi:hypothetical protein
VPSGGEPHGEALVGKALGGSPAGRLIVDDERVTPGGDHSKCARSAPRLSGFPVGTVRRLAYVRRRGWRSLDPPKRRVKRNAKLS